MRIIPNQSKKRFVSCLMKNGQKSIRLNPINSVTSIRMNSNHFELGFIQIDSDWKFGLDQSQLGLIRIDLDWKLGFGLVRIHVLELIGLDRIDFWPFFIKRDTKRFSDWFGIIRIGSDTDVGMNRNSSDWLGMNRNSSDWLGMNFNPLISPG